jgi:hypothetical protein
MFDSSFVLRSYVRKGVLAGSTARASGQKNGDNRSGPIEWECIMHSEKQNNELGGPAPFRASKSGNFVERG